MLKILKNLKDYDLVCKKRDYHEPNPDDLEEFIKNSKFPTETFCKDCGFALELRTDDEDPDFYWVQEI